MIELRLLGALQLSATDGRDVESLVRQSKRTGLLAYLAAANPQGFHRRDKLLALFWPESDEAHARAALSQALYVLRNALGEQAVVTTGRGEVGLSSELVWCDVAAFEAALDAGRPDEALTLYRGDLLDGFFVSGAPEFERWIDTERARLKQRAAEGAWTLAEAKATAGNAVEAERWARRASEFLADDEAVVRRLMTFLHRLGDKSAAIRAYEAFSWRLAQEHEVEPSVETRKLVAAIRGEQSNAVATDTTEPAAADPSNIGAARRRFASGWLTAVTVAAIATMGTLVVVARRSSSGSPERAALATSTAYERTAIAVLPFQNLSAEGPYAYFAGGLRDEISTQLSKVTALKVISRTSVTGYAGPDLPPLRQIAAELGVGSIVEASVQVIGERVRVNVQLIDAATDARLWAERYDRALDDAFAIQSDIAQQIVTAVGAALGTAERRALTDAPTANAEAYLLVLQGREYWNRPGFLERNLESAQQLYERALTLDPDFALAHAALSDVHGRMYWHGFDPSATRLALQREEAQAALRLAPDLPQAHMAIGWDHYRRRRDYHRALREFAIALEGLPNDAETWFALAAVHRRLGNWDEALTAVDHVMRLSPRQVDAIWDLGAQTYRLLHRYAEAVWAYDRAMALAPDIETSPWSPARVPGLSAIDKGWTYVQWQGQFDSLRSALNRLPVDHAYAGLNRAYLLYWERKPDSLLQMLRATPVSDLLGYNIGHEFSGWAHQLRGDEAAARVAFDSALVVLDSVTRENPDLVWDPRAHRGMVLAALGRREEALRVATWLHEHDMYDRDAYDGPSMREHRAFILALLGDADAALEQIEPLLEGPSWMSVHSLRFYPLWDPIREHPRFKALLAKYGYR